MLIRAGVPTIESILPPNTLAAQQEAVHSVSSLKLVFSFSNPPCANPSKAPLIIDPSLWCTSLPPHLCIRSRNPSKKFWSTTAFRSGLPPGSLVTITDPSSWQQRTIVWSSENLKIMHWSRSSSMGGDFSSLGFFDLGSIYFAVPCTNLPRKQRKS